MLRLILISFLFAPHFLMSQKALDFKLTDTNGKKWHLFDELNKGKTVLLDFFYADCVPCQTLTPQIEKIYQDYGSDTGQVLVLGISDRDNNVKLKKFELDYGVTYPSCGAEGNGDSITQAYQSWFTFVGWPTYAVVCPNRNLRWNLDKNTNGQPVIRDSLDECIKYTGIENKTYRLTQVSIREDQLVISNIEEKKALLRIYNVQGRIQSEQIIYNKSMVKVGLSDLNAGIYIAVLSGNNASKSYKFIKQH